MTATAILGGASPGCAPPSSRRRPDGRKAAVSVLSRACTKPLSRTYTSGTSPPPPAAPVRHVGACVGQAEVYRQTVRWCSALPEQIQLVAKWGAKPIRDNLRSKSAHHPSRSARILSRRAAVCGSLAVVIRAETRRGRIPTDGNWYQASSAMDSRPAGEVLTSPRMTRSRCSPSRANASLRSGIYSARW